MKTTRNQASVIGNLTQDPVLRSTRTGRSVCNFTVATHETRKDPEGDGYVSHTEYHQCVAWGVQGENVHQRLRKGDLVSVEGPLRTRTNKTETATYYNTTIEVHAWDFLHRPRPKEGAGEGDSGSSAAE